MPASQIITILGSDWFASTAQMTRPQLLAALEQGKVLVFPDMPPLLTTEEAGLLDPAYADPKRKNISFNSHNGTLLGVSGDDATRKNIGAILTRFNQHASQLLVGLLPEYVAHLRQAPASLRLHRVETRRTSWRKDDSRLHIDAFASRPNRGERILRVFLNINPLAEPRIWRVGESFETVAKRFLPLIPRQWPGSAALLRILKITKSRRSRYDHIMLHLHDAMKADRAYQQSAVQESVHFAPNTAWVCFSDQTSHAVMSGQFMLEQTWFLPAAHMIKPEHAPLGILQRLTGQALIHSTDHSD